MVTTGVASGKPPDAFPRKCLLMTIAEEAPPRLDDFDPQHMSILAWAYATLEPLGGEIAYCDR